ncbi:MAG TPA: A24 family peptidase [Methylocystis sp.]|nr:A24 family peptidase [Methylocystis sp.]
MTDNALLGGVLKLAPFSTPWKRRRCRRLAREGGDALLARPPARAHCHVLWIGLLAFGYLLSHPPSPLWVVAPSLVLFAALAVIVVFDIRYFLIPDGPVLLLLLAGLATGYALDPGLLPERLIAAAGAFAALRLAGLAYRRWRGVEGLGPGDARLFALMGLWLGAPALPGSLFVAALSGLVSALILLRANGPGQAREALPFGPHLALAFWLAWTLGPVELG